MNEVLIWLSIGYVFLAALLMLCLLYTRLPIITKAVLFAITVSFYFVSYFSWQQSQGWPSKAALPAHFLLHYGVIEEPDEERQTDGAIYLWITDLKDQTLADQPRAYVLPYSRDGHGALDEALRQTRNGKRQLGRNLELPDPLNPIELNDGIGDTQFKLRFSELPDPALPEK
jgi:hypothetical protein